MGMCLESGYVPALQKGEGSMNLQVVSIAALVVFLLVFMVFMWEIYSGIRQSLKDNVEEVLIVSGEYIGEQIRAAEHSMTERMNILQSENKSLRQEMNELLDAMSKNAETLQTTTLKNFEAEVKRFIQVIDTSCSNLDKAAQEQSKTLASTAGTIQSVLTTGVKDIQSSFATTREALQDTVNNAMKQQVSEAGRDNGKH